MKKNPVIAITMGDPGGVGPEVILKSLQSFKASSRCTFVVLGIPAVFNRLAKQSSVFRKNLLKILFWDVSQEVKRIYAEKNKKCPAVIGFDAGKHSFQNAASAFAALKVAAREAAAGEFQGVVTAPVNKTSMKILDAGFHGHTEYLAKTSGSSEFAMMFVSDKLKVTLTTIHEPIKKVPDLITTKRVFEKIKLTDIFLKKHLKIKSPRIAVCALNPHGKETGHEDEKEIRPAVRHAVSRGMRVFGPLSADQLFFDAYHKRYDAVIAMYHDQGLAPFKMIAFEDGVNVTLGLPYIRTSPDHGTAFDIAYQNKANPVSMLSALTLAQKLVI